MKKISLTTGLFLLIFWISSLFPKSPSSVIEKKVNNLLSQMTLEEKIGQMTQITIQVVSKSPESLTSKHQLDEEKLREAIIKYHVGSIFNVFDAAYTPDHWHEIITKIQDIATKETRLGIPVLYGIDAIHGANYTVGATLFPQSLGMAATFNTSLVQKEGEITAFEVRASGIPWNFNPVLGVGRNPLWPRLFETYGEDTYLVSQMGKAYIKGLEGENNDINQPNKVAACMKHYLGYSFPLSGRDRTPAWIPERQLREIFLPPFAEAVKAGVHTVMINSSEINGIPVHSNKYLLTDVLRKELGFQGIVVSDWRDIINLWDREKTASTRKEAVKMAIMAGVDMSMVPYDYSFYKDLIELVKEGEVPESRIDEAVRRILRLKFELGLFTNPYPDPKMGKKIGNPDFIRVAKQAALESLTLLKNANQILPLKKNLRVLVTGPAANLLSTLNGGWTFTWQGNEERLYPKNKLTIMKAIQKKIGSNQVVFIPVMDFEEEVDISPALDTLRDIDVAIVVLGEPAYSETPGNINDLNLPDAQINLVKSIHRKGFPIVLVLTEGRPRLINRIVDDVQAILMAYLPGLEGGPAIADVLFGDYNPSGKLPITYPKYSNALICYDYKNSEQTTPNKWEPQFPFGYGLSYTTFLYSNLAVNKTFITEADEIKISVKVKNTGKRRGKEVVLLYVSDLIRSITPPVRQLRRFRGVWLDPGESKTLTFTLNASDLSFIGRNNERIVEPGEFKVTIGNLETSFWLISPEQVKR